MTIESFQAGYLEIDPYELVDFLLSETGQYDREAVNPADLLDYLKLEALRFDFRTSLPPEAHHAGSSPRALLSFEDRLVAVDRNLNERRSRFSLLHEVAHYVLPEHQWSMYLCDDIGLSAGTNLDYEKQANAFAADVLFKGPVFVAAAAQMPVSVRSIVTLADRYGASFEATARRFVERSLRPVMLVVFQRHAAHAGADVDSEPRWGVKYCIPSPAFRTRYFSRVTGVAPTKIARTLDREFGDITRTETTEVTIPGREGELLRFQGEFFFNRYNIMCLLTPGGVTARMDKSAGQGE